MKMIFAYVQPFMLEKVTDALRMEKIHSVTVIQCQGFGRLSGGNPHYLDVAAELGYAPKAKVEIVCRDEEARAIADVIRKNAHTGHFGDGKIFISDVTQALDIRTDSEGDASL